MKKGNERACHGCKKIFEFYEFPFDSINLCFKCWEIKHNKTLHDKKFRKLTKVIEAQSFQKFGKDFNYDELICKFDEYKIYESLLSRKYKTQVNDSVKTERRSGSESETRCPACSSANYEKKGFRKEKQRYVCKDCGRNWTSGGIIKNVVFRKPKTKDTFQRENTLEEIIVYLKNQETNNMPLKFWYRDDIKPREMHDYFIDEKYVQVRADKGYYIKFLIDKIRKIEE